ncbi:MAG: hypothetical protein QXJ32_01925 [Thermoplasmata archaeon]
MSTLRRTAYVVAAVSVAVVLVLAAYLLAFSTVEVSGVVDHKMITGIRNGVQYPLVIMVPGGGIEVYDSVLYDLFEGQDVNMTINSTLERAILNWYPQIKYLVSIRLTSRDSVNNLNPGDTLAYFVNREGFNDLRFWDNVEFAVQKGKVATIAQVDTDNS